MCPVIRISDELYTRLESHAIGFDTPAALIERLLDKCDGISQRTRAESSIKPELLFEPSDEEQFKARLLNGEQAAIQLHKVDGSVENRIWRGDRLTTNSNLRGNLWSGLLRGWKKKGIIKVILSIVDH